MGKYIYIILFAILAIGIGTALKWHSDMEQYKAQYERASNNIRAIEAEANCLKNNNREYLYTIDELKQSKDSINQKLLETTKKLNIKEKNIQYLQYQSSVITKTDTITLVGDTIFKETMPVIDTLVSDEWYATRLKLEYPSSIIVSPTFISKKQVIVSKKREYNNTPSKIFFIRWFQKKHDVVTVDVIEGNPYIQEDQTRFIKIIK
ncbi:MAG: hypothetical protein IJU02_07185 [Lachnospiraceae bacterium]|nr:hypothetical protein [Lachnospiraceae bacterium]